MALGAFLVLSVKGYLTVELRDSDAILNQLSWQSALWAVVAMALTTMADLPSSLDGYPEDLTFYLKANPLTCLANVLTTVLVLTPSNASSLNQRLLHLATDKFGSQGFERLDHRPIRMVLFILGAAPQAVKLYACRGVVLTQLIASCYLLDFFNDELILLYARRRALRPSVSTIQTDPNDQQIRRLDPAFLKSNWTNFAYYMNVIWAFASLYYISLHDAITHSSYWASLGTFLACPAGYALYWLSTFVAGPSEHLKQELRLLLYPTAMAVCWTPSTLLFIFTDQVVWAVLSMYLGAFASYLFLGTGVSGIVQKSNAHFPKFAYFALASLNLVTYDTTMYDATQTSRPGWIEWFG